jgi:hypothetical protein
MKKRILTAALLLFSILPEIQMAAQEKSKTQVVLSTDVVDWAALGTINLEAGVSLHQHFSLLIKFQFQLCNQ